jgi:hypothetical protein
MYEDEEIVLAVAGQVGHRRSAWLGERRRVNQIPRKNS